MFFIQQWKQNLQTPTGRVLVFASSGSVAALGVLGTAYGLADSLALQIGWTEAEVKTSLFLLIKIFMGVALIAGAGIALFVPGRTIWHYFNERRQLRCMCCHYGDLHEIDRLADEAFGGEASNLRDIQRLWAIDQRCFWKVCRIKDGGHANDAVGYFCVLRLSTSGASSVLEGTFTGASPPTSHIEKSRRKKCRNAYIGAIYGKSAFAKGMALAALTTYLEILKPEKVYARGLPGHGIRLLEKNGFRLLPDPRAAAKGFYLREG
jgi:hypothetical protein